MDNGGVDERGSVHCEQGGAERPRDVWGSTDDGSMDKRGGVNEGSTASLRDAWGGMDDSGADERGSANIHGLHMECPSSWPSSAWWMPSGACCHN